MTQNALAGLLSAWLPGQRWFAGGDQVGRVEIASDVVLAEGEPEFRHLLADVWSGRRKVRYQVPVGIRAGLPPSLAAAAIGALPDGRIAYDGASDPDLAAVLLRGIATQRRAGPLRFATEPGAVIDVTAPPRTLPALASNTSIVFGDKAILKLLRRPFSGHHPDLEVPAALARNGSRLVAAPLGWIEMAGTGQGGGVQVTAEPGQEEEADQETAVLAILSVFFARSSDGWSLATASLRAGPPDFTRQAELLGEATARMHGELAAAFGTAVLSPYARQDMAEAMATELRQATRAVPALVEHAAAVQACYDALAADAEVAVQRIHGDYHLAQVLGTDAGWVVLDFEGEPSVPLARRRAFAPPLRDVAGMLRSFDYAARHEVLRRPDDGALARTAADWARRCQDAFCGGYATVMGTDPRDSGPLLRALVLSKAVYEAVYEASHRPGWLPIPLAAIAEASR